MKRDLRAWLVALLVVAATGCNVQKNLWQSGLPGLKSSFVVTKSEPVFGYIEADLVGSGMHLDSFTPNNADCAEVLKPEAAVDYVANGPYGTFQRGEQTCSAIGLGSLREWRDRRPSQTTVAMLPRAQADFRVVFQDSKQVFLRGRFPLGGLLGFTGMDDTIAIVPNIPECQQPIKQSVASMQYYQNGENPLVLLSGDGECPIRALLQPLPGSEIKQW
jgi:hypothetical protein